MHEAVKLTTLERVSWIDHRRLLEPLGYTLVLPGLFKLQVIYNLPKVSMATYKGTIEIEALDIPSMARMSDDEYKAFLGTHGLFWIDHHEILRSTAANYPLATRKSQLDILVGALQQCRDRMREENLY